jgi:hypothetical protein
VQSSLGSGESIYIGVGSSQAANDMSLFGYSETGTVIYGSALTAPAMTFSTYGNTPGVVIGSGSAPVIRTPNSTLDDGSGDMVVGGTVKFGGSSGTTLTSGANVSLTGPASISQTLGVLGLRPMFIAGSMSSPGQPVTLTQSAGSSAAGITLSSNTITVTATQSNIVLFVAISWTGSVPASTLGIVETYVAANTNINGSSQASTYNADSSSAHTVTASTSFTMVSTSNSVSASTAFQTAGFTNGSGSFYVCQLGP